MTGGCYKNYRYKPEEDDSGDVVKIDHVVINPDGLELYVPFTPYKHMTMKDFSAWVDLGRPSRRDFGLIGCWQPGELLDMLIGKVMAA